MDLLLATTTLDDEVYQPDILFISNENEDVIIASHIIGPPDLIVEILSPSTADGNLYHSTVLTGFTLKIKELRGE